MNPKHFLAAIALLLFATCGSRAEQPNVIFFLIDDLGRHDCGFMGGKEIRTPNIDKLAAAGATLDAFYVQPLCSPTRAAFLTGRYPMRYGLQSGVVKPWATHGLPPEEKTIADDLKAAGYATGIFGKWHLGHSSPEFLPTHRGFTHQYGHYNGAIDYFTHEREGGWDWHENDKINRDVGYSTTLLGEKAAQFVTENASQEKPFFLYLPFNAVHGPYQPPKNGTEAYPNLTGVRQKYAAMLTEVDNAIGKIVAAVEKAGIRDNTIFLFSSDNGGPSPGRITDNGQYRGSKGGLYEGGVRVAAFATWDGHVPPGTKITEPMHIVDLRPTLNKLCGAAQTNDLPMDGRDVSGTVAAGEPSPHEFILLNTTPSVGAIRAGDWKLIVKKAGKGSGKKKARKRGGAAVELFNLRDDPYETTNLAEKHSEKVKELRQQLDRLAAEAVPPKSKPMPSNFKRPKIWGEAG
jgi:arylsulfatase A-like enzyme